jgi:hypothetical protein
MALSEDKAIKCLTVLGGKCIFREKNSIPANTGIDIFEIPVLYRPGFCIFNTELETLDVTAFVPNGNKSLAGKV